MDERSTRFERRRITRAEEASRYTWARDRKWAAAGLFGVLLLGLYYFTPGLPVASAPNVSHTTFAAGRELFVHQWTRNDPLARGDGLGPVFNDNSCAACHNQGGLGGGGGSAHNVRAFSAFPDPKTSHELFGGLHSLAVNESYKEPKGIVKTLYLCSTEHDINTTALFGAGWIDKVSDQALRFEANRQAIRGAKHEVVGDFRMPNAGKIRVLADGRIGKFGWKAQFATLEEFVASAAANEVGLGTPIHAQAAPLGRTLGAVESDLTAGQLASLTGFVAGLARPEQLMPVNARERESVVRGEKVFQAVGCACCHVPDMAGIQGIYSDLLLHVIKDPGKTIQFAYGGGAPVPENSEEASEWRTPPLWGVADSPPFMHDGRAGTLAEAIALHGGDATPVTQRYNKLDPGERNDLLAFLSSLRAPAQPDPTRENGAPRAVASR